MIRGTTPTLRFTLPFSTSTIATLYITLNQNSATKLEKTIYDVRLDENTIILNLTQEDTLLFSAVNPISIQLRVKTNDGNALASKIITTDMGKILKDGVI